MLVEAMHELKTVCATDVEAEEGGKFPELDDPPTIIWFCPVCGKMDHNRTEKALATPEHVPMRGVDIGNCKGKMLWYKRVDSRHLTL